MPHPYQKFADMLIRRAELKDAKEILRWRNDPQTRAMSRNDSPIEEQAHNSWFEGVLRAQDRVLLMGVISDKSIGMVRFDRRNSTTRWAVSIAIAPEERGKGIGNSLLTLALTHFFETYPDAELFAEIKHHNDASMRLFKSAGFIQVTSDEEMFQSFLKRNTK